MIELRPANEGDLDWLVRELKKFDEFYPTKKSVFGAEPYVRKKLVEIMRDHVFILAEENEARVGFIAGVRQPHFYNPDVIVLHQLFWWVVAEKRHSTAAYQLIDEFVAYGKENADWITLNMSPLTPLNRKSFLKKGFVVSDQVYLMEVL